MTLSATTWPRAAAVALCLAAVSLSSGPSPANAHDQATTRRGPAGTRFYDPPRLPRGPHGTLIWAAPLHGGSALPGAVNTRILYTQTGVNGKQVATSGSLSIPRGPAPRGGWPIITWGHGTTGLADQCAPSRGYRSKSTSDQTLLARWVHDGYAVVNTDYEGSGTPGAVPYLIGRPSAYAMLDAVRAARQFDTHLSRNYLIGGHSEGAAAALWASAIGPGYLRGFNLRGVIAFASPSEIGAQIAASTEQTGSAATFTLALIIQGLDVAYPSLHGASLLSPAAAAPFSQTTRVCAVSLSDDFAHIPADQMFRPGADLQPLVLAADRNQVTQVRPRVPLLLEQGADDTTVKPATAEALAARYRREGVRETFDLVPDATHESVSALGAPQATRFLRAHLR